MDTVSEQPWTSHGITHWLSSSSVNNQTQNLSDSLSTGLSPTNSSLTNISESLSVEFSSTITPLLNISSTSEPGTPPLTWEVVTVLVLKAFIMGTIIVVAIMGNALVIVSISLNRKLQVLTNFFLVSLAIADMLVALCAMTFNASVELSGKWLFGYIMCDMFNSFDVYFSTVSILHLCCISMDRYYAILNPLEYPVKVTKRIVLVTLANVWILPALISFLPIHMGWYTTNDHLKDRYSESDSCTFEVNKYFAILSSTVSFWFPCTVMVILYYRIYQEARKQETAILSRTNSMSTLHNIHHRGLSPTLTIRRILARIRARRSALRCKRNKNKQDLPMCPLSSFSCRNHQRDRTQSIYSTGSDMQVPCSYARGSTPGRCNFPLPPPPHCIITEAEDDNDDHVSINSQIASIHGSLTNHDLSSADDTIETSITNGRGSEPSRPSLSSGVGLLPSSTRNNSTGTCNQLMIPMNPHISQGVPTMRREHKAAKTLGIIMGAFILCWLPFFSWYVITTICGEEACPCPQELITTLFWIGYFNSTLNPFIYAYFRRDFRDAFKKTLWRLQCCCETPPQARGAYV